MVLFASSEASKACFGKAPKTFYAINMCLASGEFVAVMINSQMLAVANINKTIIASLAIWIDDAFRFDFTSYNGLECSF